jgi:hypothetical protein
MDYVRESLLVLISSAKEYGLTSKASKKINKFFAPLRLSGSIFNCLKLPIIGMCKLDSKPVQS